jgi:hypothetical protein
MRKLSKILFPDVNPSVASRADSHSFDSFELWSGLSHLPGERPLLAACADSTNARLTGISDFLVFPSTKFNSLTATRFPLSEITG